MQYNFYVILLLCTGILLAGFGMVAFRRQLNATEKLFMGVIVCMVVWTVAYAFELMSIHLAGKLWAIRVEYLGACVLPVMWLMFVITHTGKGYILTPRFVAALLVVPVISLIIIMTSSHHMLFYVQPGLAEVNGFVHFLPEHGPWFWVVVVYSYGLILLSSVYLIYSMTITPDAYRGQRLLLASAMIIPLLANLIFLLTPTTARFDFTPIGFAFAATLTGFDLLRFEALDLQPLARNTVFENLNALVFVLDGNDRIRDANPHALKVMNLSRRDLLGYTIPDFFPGADPLPGKVQNIVDHPRQPIQTTLHLDGRIYDVNIQPVFSRGETRFHGRVATMHDITELVKAREAERIQRQFAFALTDGMASLAQNLERGRRIIFTRIIESVKQVVDYDRASIMVLEGQDVIFAAHKGYTPDQQDLLNDFRQPLTVFTRIDRMIATREPDLISVVAEEPNWVHFDHLPTVRSYIGFPIIRGDEVVGILNLDSLTPGTFKPEHVERLQGFAAQAAIALENARLVENLRRKADLLAMRNADLDAFSFTVAHDLNTPLTQMIGLIKTLNERSDLDRAAASILSLSLANARKMRSMIKGLLIFARQPASADINQTLDLADLAREAVRRFTEEIAERRIRVMVCDDMPAAYGYPLWVEEVLANLIGNAIKYIGESNPDPRITIDAIREGDHVRVNVTDNGVGIPESHQKTIFDLFNRVQIERTSGHGIGLAIVHRIVTRLGGQAGLESTPGEGACFWFTLPDPHIRPDILPAAWSLSES